MPEEQQYFVEVFDSKFNPLCHIGPVNHKRALEVHEEYKKRNLLSVEVTSEAVARSAISLCTDNFSTTTGASVPTDGGSDRVI